MPEDLILFTRLFDLLAWLVPRSETFPRAFRNTVTQRLLDAALDCQESALAAQGVRSTLRATHLAQADTALARLRLYLRLYLRLAHHWRWLSDGQYEHVSHQVAEVGRLLGGWLRQEGRAATESGKK